MPALPRSIVAIEARDFVIPCVYLVGESNRLIRRVALIDSYVEQLPTYSGRKPSDADTEKEFPYWMSDSPQSSSSGQSRSV
jgi:hypothetical protein